MRRRIRPRYRVGLTAFIALAAMALFTSAASAIVAGAGFTTNDPNIDGNGTCLNGNSDPNPSVNCNLYGSKSFVWINGGPSGGQNSLTDGTYFFAVLEPSGQNDPNDGGANNLSDTDPAGGVADPNLCLDAGTNTFTGCGDSYDTDREFTVSGGKIDQNLGTHADDPTYSALGLLINLMPYDTTSNNGGVYILAICSLANGYPVDPSDCKYDAFKAPNPACTENCNPTPFGVVEGEKYYDGNRNGQLDPGEAGIPGWPINWSDIASGTVLTDSNGEFSLSLTADTYSFTEVAGSSPWVQTGNTVNQFTDTGGNSTSLSSFVYTVSVVDGGLTTGLNFGNVCPINGLTMGFWSNKNGLALVIQADFDYLNNLNLKNATGGDVVFSGTLANEKKQLNAFLVGASSVNAKNMAFILSGQLTALVLNVRHGFTDGNAVVYGDGRTVNQIISDANALLALYPLTVKGSAARTAEEAIKNVIASINQNQAARTLADCLEQAPVPTP